MGKYKNGRSITGEITVPSCQAKIVRRIYKQIAGKQYPGFDYRGPDVSSLTNGAENKTHAVTIYLDGASRDVMERFRKDVKKWGVKQGINLP